MRRILGVGAVALLALACGKNWMGPEQGQACTLIGCDDELSVHASAALGWSFGVEIALDGQTISVECNLADDVVRMPGNVTGGTLSVDCVPDGIIVRELPEQLTVRFLDEDGTVLGEGALSPDYEERYPNGEECGAACEQGEAVVQTVVAKNPNPNA
jgi:hypothetical protein